jgi:hypothetical protein
MVLNLLNSDRNSNPSVTAEKNCLEYSISIFMMFSF